MESIQAKLSLRYDWDSDFASGVDFAALGGSLIGFDRLLRNYVEVLRLRGDVKIEAQSAREGSVVVDLALQLYSTALFHDWQSYVDLMQLVGQQIPQTVIGGAKEIHEDVNAFASQYPVDTMIIEAAILKLFVWGSLQKTKPTTHDNGNILPTRYAVGLSRMVKSHKYRKAFSPLVTDAVKEIQIVAPQKDPFVVDLRNFSNYLSEDERILPDLKNGVSYNFKGEIVGLESSKGEFLRFRALELPKQHRLLTAFPTDGKDTGNYLGYYKKQVLLTAEVVRKSEYQRPRLKIEEIELLQTPLA